MEKKKAFVCVEMKHKIQRKILKESKASNVAEYAEFVNKRAMESSLWKQLEKNNCKND